MADKEFRGKVNQKLPESHKLADPDSKPKPGTYQVIFGIISSSSDSLELPFFSKVALRNARRRLEAFGYEVALQKISAED